MASQLTRTITALSLALTFYFASTAASVRADMSSQSSTNLHAIKFYLDPALVPDMEFAKAVLPKYVADMNWVLAKNTNRQLVFDPTAGIIPTGTKPQTDSASSPLPTEGFQIWAHAIQSAYSLSYGGYAGIDTSGAGVLAGLRWTRLYDPDHLASTDVLDYTLQINNMLHELAHVFGAGIGEYYNLDSITDTTGTEPSLNIDVNSAIDSYWSDKPDFMVDPLLQLTRKPTRLEYLAAVQYSELTATIINVDYRNGFVSLDHFTVQVLDQAGQPVPGAEVKVWSVQTGSPYTSQLMFDEAADENGHATLIWGGSYDSHNSANLLRLIKVYKDGAPITPARYISTFDLDIAQLVQGQTSFTVTMQQVNQPSTASFTSIAANDGWVLESGRSSNKGGSLNTDSGKFLLGNDANNRRYRSVLAFNTSNLPDDAIITGVTLMIKRQGVVGANPFTVFKSLTIDIGTPIIGTKAGLQTADFQAQAGQASAGTFENRPDPNGWYSATLQASALALVNLEGSTQFRLRFSGAGSSGADYLAFYSGNAAPANRPVLTVEYELPGQ